eukprot:COSAG01_NODE_155_length_23814_cov_12.061343_17_plen_579_part_00
MWPHAQALSPVALVMEPEPEAPPDESTRAAIADDDIPARALALVMEPEPEATPDESTRAAIADDDTAPDAGWGLMDVLSNTAEERQRTITANHAAQAERLVQLQLDTDAQLLRYDIAIEAERLAVTAAGGFDSCPTPPLVRSNSARALVGQCRAHLQAGRNRECIAIAEVLCRRPDHAGSSRAEAHALHGRALFRCRRWKLAAEQLRLALACSSGAAAYLCGRHAPECERKPERKRRQALLRLAARAERNCNAVRVRRDAAHAAAQQHTAESLGAWYGPTLLERAGAPPLDHPPQQMLDWMRSGQAKVSQRILAAQRGSVPSYQETLGSPAAILSRLSSPAAHEWERRVNDAYILGPSLGGASDKRCMEGGPLPKLADFRVWDDGGSERRGVSPLQEFPLTQATGCGMVHDEGASIRLPFGGLHMCLPDTRYGDASLARLRALASAANAGDASAAQALPDAVGWRRRCSMQHWPEPRNKCGESWGGSFRTGGPGPLPVAPFPTVEGSHHLPPGVRRLAPGLDVFVSAPPAVGTGRASSAAAGYDHSLVSSALHRQLLRGESQRLVIDSPWSRFTRKRH